MVSREVEKIVKDKGYERISELAKELKLSVWTVYRMVEDNAIKTVKAGGVSFAHREGVVKAFKKTNPDLAGMLGIK